MYGKFCFLTVALALLPIAGRCAEGDLLPGTGGSSQAAAGAMKKFSLAPGFKIEPFATEPDIQNVVNFCFDEKGNAYVVETHRRRTSVFDIRGLTPWLDEDFALRTVEDRADFLRRHLDGNDTNFLAAAVQTPRRGGIQDFNHDGKIDWRDLEVESERIRFLEVRDGKVISSRTFADGFSSIVSGVAAGILARHGQVYFTCIPDLWQIGPRSGDAPPKLAGSDSPRTGDPGYEIKNLLHGFGVHVALGGHDMHGLKFGPDGKLYWSIADRATSTNLFPLIQKPFPGLTPELLANSGAVFRINPDGTEFEVVAIGLRNPQELAFDDFGNLFTGDNNADGGDKARWEYVVEGGDYGWRIGWQWQPKLGAWNSEMLWGLEQSNTAAYLLPPVAHIGHGPAGIAHYPGTGLPDEFQDHFFLTDFPGGVRHFKVNPAGASFTIENPGEYLLNNSSERIEGKLAWNLYPTDIDFGLEGGAYVSDWVEGWEKTGKGRIWRIFEPQSSAQSVVAETKSLLTTGMDKRSPADLIKLLGHPDQRVRMAAQEALVDRAKKGDETAAILKVTGDASRGNSRPVARFHAMSILGQLARSHPEVWTGLRGLTADAVPEIRAQSARILGADSSAGATAALRKLLRDENPRVRYFAADSLGRLGSPASVPLLIQFLRDAQNASPFLRHAAVLALARTADLPAVLRASQDSSPAVRLGLCLVLRRWHRPEIAAFLRDTDSQVALEAARAINDEGIDQARPQLADALTLLGKNPGPHSVFAQRRAINASFRGGQAVDAKRLVSFASDASATPALRVESLELLALWSKPPGRDQIIGLWRPLPARDPRPAAEALLPALSSLMKMSEAIQVAAIHAASALSLSGAGEALGRLVSDESAPINVRVEALKAIGVLKDPKLAELVSVSLKSTQPALRKEASSLQTQLRPSNALAQLGQILATGTWSEQQSALTNLASLEGSDLLLGAWLDKLLAGGVRPELQLEILEAAARRPSLQAKVQLYEQKRNARDPLSKYRESVAGGDARSGRQIFFERQEASCIRCHKINGEGGDVGPDLTGVGSRHPREYLLESMVLPNAQIAAGFESVVLTMKDGVIRAGVLKGETASELTLNSPEDGLLKLKKSDIASRERGLSPMPEGLGEVLSRRDLRDLVEFLSQSR